MQKSAKKVKLFLANADQCHKMPTMTATLTRNEAPAMPSTRDNQHWLTVPCPQGWDDVRPLTGRVLRFDNRSYIFRGWNSDKNEAYFIHTETAVIK